jgi:hypothetical protein
MHTFFASSINNVGKRSFTNFPCLGLIVGARSSLLDMKHSIRSMKFCPMCKIGNCVMFT